jgi:hypothetical protein
MALTVAAEMPGLPRANPETAASGSIPSTLFLLLRLAQPTPQSSGSAGCTSFLHCSPMLDSARSWKWGRTDYVSGPCDAGFHRQRRLVRECFRARLHPWRGRAFGWETGYISDGNAVLECQPILGGWRYQGADAPRSPGGDVFKNLAKNTQRGLPVPSEIYTIVMYSGRLPMRVRSPSGLAGIRRCSLTIYTNVVRY